MRLLSGWLVVAMLVCGAGCEKYVVSLKPLCPDESCVSVAGFEGKWASNDQVWTVRPKELPLYEVRVSDIGSVARFDGRIRHIGDCSFLELNPVKRESIGEEVPSLYAVHWLQASSFMKMTLAGDVLNLDRMNADELKQKLEEKPDLIKHVSQGDNIVLVDDTEALVQFVQAQADVNELWQEHGPFVRCSPLYTTEDLIQVDGLVGRWVDPNEGDEGPLDVQTEGDHYSIQFGSDSDERLTFSANLFRFQNCTVMGGFMGSEDSRAREMATRMPDWFALVTLEDARLKLSFLDTMEVQALLTHPEKAQEVLVESEMTLSLVKP
jgi:hypothetical protein